MNPYPTALPTAEVPTPYRTEPVRVVGDAAIEELRQTRPWVTLMSVLSALACAFIVMVSIAIGAAGVARSGKPIVALTALFYLPMGALYVYPAIALWWYRKAIAALEASRSPDQLELALRRQKSFWKYCGIATVIVIVVYFGLAFVLLAIWQFLAPSR
jgi:hypothetical protein